MGKEVAIVKRSRYEKKHDGKALASLPDQYRAFVLRLMELGPSKKAAAKAAKDVGFVQNYGYELMRDERVLAAIREESTKELAGSVLIGVKAMIEIAQDRDHRDRFKAAKELAGMNGFTTEQRVVVEHISHDTKEQMRQIRAMAIELGLNPEQIIKSAGIVEAEFEEVENDADSI